VNVSSNTNLSDTTAALSTKLPLVVILLMSFLVATATKTFAELVSRMGPSFTNDPVFAGILVASLSRGTYPALLSQGLMGSTSVFRSLKIYLHKR
jgi:hypothetical protein